MPTKSAELQRQTAELIECIENLRAVLLRYKQANVALSMLVEGGTPTLEALERVDASRLRPELTDALDQFAGARHEARVALLSLALRQGASMAEVGRAFSVSRQLASRLAAEIKRGS
jgi:predicted transcriptional regulator